MIECNCSNRTKSLECYLINGDRVCLCKFNTGDFIEKVNVNCNVPIGEIDYLHSTNYYWKKYLNNETKLCVRQQISKEEYESAKKSLILM